MLVKCQTFRKDSFHATATERARYLERDSRALDVSTQNIANTERWYREMDRTRDSYRLRGSVTGREYILSPDPADADFSQLSKERQITEIREFAHEFLRRNFPTAEAAVVIHDDNKGRLSSGEAGIVHAHVYVNTPDLETGRKIVISNAKAREIHDSAQELSEKRGWRALERYYDKERNRVRALERTAIRRSSWERQLEHDAGYEASGLATKGIDQSEYEAAKSGREYDKTYLRRNLREATKEAKSGRQLEANLKSRGIECSKASNGDVKYRVTGSKLWFKGATLAADLCRREIERSIERARSNEVELGR